MVVYVSRRGRAAHTAAAALFITHLYTARLVVIKKYVQFSQSVGFHRRHSASHHFSLKIERLFNHGVVINTTNQSFDVWFP
jgi:hypothetical protein